jgi:cytochrome b subunit of formate dehydrogenase/nitrate/TMAO reductase-like tetraheme cytochrome c subunit
MIRRMPRIHPFTLTISLTAMSFAAACTVAFAQTAEPRGVAATDNRRCLNCHGQPHIATLGPEDRRVMVALPAGEAMPERASLDGLFVDPAARAADVHRNLACTACHPDGDRLPHPPRLGPAECASCHTQAADAFRNSIHAEAALQPSLNAPHCWDCHGTHDIRPKSDRKSLVYPLSVIQVCGGCHSEHVGEPYAPQDGREAVAAYMDSVHGRAARQAGLVVAATCADCHGYHEVWPSSDPRSLAHHSNVSTACGRCHVGIEEVFETSIHAEVARTPGGAERAPACNDCHSSHAITRADEATFLRDVVGECGACHADLYHTYRESFHGKMQRLGSRRAARCSDCHGAHNVRRVDDPASTLSAENRADTCARCHGELRTMSERARDNFVQYRPHANFRSRATDPILFYIWLYFIIIIGVTFTFWGLHSAAWFVRGTVDRVRHGPHPRHAGGPHAIKRFSAWHRWTHVMVMVSFMGLTLTGIPLKFNDQPWAAGLMHAIGGPETAGFLHRCFAVLVLVYLLMHLAHLWRNRRGDGSPLLRRIFGPNSMLPTGRDWRQFTQMVRWFFGRGEKPKFDRWTYWEKFDYWADLIGTLIIGISGLMLWFPAFFAHYVSGYWFNIAAVVHGYEALLAVGFIFTIHFFNAHLRWEKFPVDRVIFTGQVPEEEFREERAAQYERLVQTGELETLRVPAAPRWQHRLAHVAALVALLLGVSLVILIVWATLL